jgi:hypothetical protein
MHTQSRNYESKIEVMLNENQNLNRLLQERISAGETLQHEFVQTKDEHN